MLNDTGPSTKKWVSQVLWSSPTSQDISGRQLEGNIGVVLLQNEQPIAYASKVLTKSQQNYAQIEKEMLAIVFGCTRFHEYIFGLPSVEIETDHKPL